MVDDRPAGHTGDARAAGARAARNLMRDIAALCDETRDQFGSDVDGHDYFGIAAVIEECLDRHFVDGSPAHRQGFVEALAHAMCSTIDRVQPACANDAAVEVAEASFVADWLPLLAQRDGCGSKLIGIAR